MAREKSVHVQRLHRYLPFDASFDQILEEYRSSKDTLEITTNALEYLLRIIPAGPRLVILTGDAGHGKTHLCARIIKDYLNYPDTESKQALNEKCNGEVLEKKEGDGRKLRIYKDLSEFELEETRKILSQSVRDKEVTTIVCINEGRLRAALEEDSEELSGLKRKFVSSFETGLVCTDDISHIINLNYQSVATGADESLVSKVLKGGGKSPGWLHGSFWKICESCDSRGKCPIYRNKQLLSDSDFPQRKERLQELFAIIERLGTVVTIREILMAYAYFLTGGLSCENVHKSREDGWQHEYMFYNLAFSHPKSLTHDKLSHIPVLSSFWQLDPGRVSIREVDERLINDPIFSDANFELKFSRKIGKESLEIDARDGIDQIIGDPQSRSERQAESDFSKDVVRNLRRRHFFDHVIDDDGELDAKLLGFGHYDDFRWLLSPGPEDPTRLVKIKKKLIQGLHTIQGLRLSEEHSTALFLVDPAFGKSTNHAAIIASKIQSSRIKILKQSDAWSIDESRKEFSLARAVDWLERQVYLSIGLQQNEQDTLFPLNLLTFDCIMRASSGYLPESFYEHDIRKIQNFLGFLAGEARREQISGIEVIVGGQQKTVSLDEGGVIDVGS